jgi:hypothetical protein
LLKLRRTTKRIYFFILLFWLRFIINRKSTGQYSSEETAMAFREHNSNILAPLYSEDTTWTTINADATRTNKEQKIRAVASKENQVVFPSHQEHGNFRKLYKPDARTSYNSSRNGANSNIIGNHCDKVTSTPSFHPIPRYKEQASSSNKEAIHSELVDDYTNTENSKQEILSARPSLKKPQNAFPPCLPSVGSNRFERNSSEFFRMETLKPSAVCTVTMDAIQGTTEQSVEAVVHHKPLSPPPGFTNYAAAAKANISNAPAGQKTAPFIKIYEENCIEKEVAQLYQSNSPKTVQQYGHKLHTLSENGDRKSAQEAEELLQEIITKYQAGIHDIRPDGGCYNRYVSRRLYFVEKQFLSTNVSSDRVLR